MSDVCLPFHYDKRTRRGEKMEPRDYIVTRIEGEYAYLRELGKEDATELFIALALLPQGTDEGKKLHYELLEYTLLD